MTTLELLFGGDQGAHVAKLSIADAADHDQVFRAAKGPVLSAMIDDAFRGDLAYARKFFEFLRAGKVDVYPRSLFRYLFLGVGLSQVDGVS